MYTPQAGIFALGTSSHAYLEFDLLDAKKYQEFAATIAAIREPRTTTGGVNFVIGFRPELWRDMVPADAPADMQGFNHDIRGTEGFVMPATQHDALVWLSGSAYDVVFDMARSVIRDLAGQATLGRGNLKLALPARSRPDRLCRWLGKSDAARRARRRPSCPREFPAPPAPSCCCKSGSTGRRRGKPCPSIKQEHVMGRTKLDSIEFENKPADSHVARTDQDEFGEIFRRNMPYGNVE